VEVFGVRDLSAETEYTVEVFGVQLLNHADDAQFKSAEHFRWSPRRRSGRGGARTAAPSARR